MGTDRRDPLGALIGVTAHGPGPGRMAGPEPVPYQARWRSGMRSRTCGIAFVLEGSRIRFARIIAGR